MDTVEGTDPERLGMRGLTRVERGRIRLGDVIVEIEGEAIRNENDYADVIERYEPGDVVTVTTMRDNRLREYEIELQAPRQ
jgi:S1-C subfamily serine protease